MHPLSSQFLSSAASVPVRAKSLFWYMFNLIKYDTLLTVLYFHLATSMRFLKAAFAGRVLAVWGMQPNRVHSIPAWSWLLQPAILRLTSIGNFLTFIWTTHRDMYFESEADMSHDTRWQIFKCTRRKGWKKFPVQYYQFWTCSPVVDTIRCKTVYCG